ncbi:MAG: D-2-hydroxyacid dehydrogenase [Pyrinomonadaceae bacterium MAG19_C2-C3]|nr:D-2-hydroxyacid dehydrogenase [Pyrinomonadaceae bacterium MAG19_C2-C3]
MPHIVFLDQATVQSELPAFSFPHNFHGYDETSAAEVVRRLKDATIAITNKVVLGAKEFAQLPALKFVALAATGYNNIDTRAAREHGVKVANVPDYASDSVPEQVMMMALALRRNLLSYRQSVRDGAWERSPHFCVLDYPILDVKGSTFGIIGFGALGQATARLAQGFGANVLVAERRGAKSVRAGRTSFERVLSESDTLSLHCPLTAETRGLIGAAELNTMKPTAVLINCARGGIVDEAALVEALQAKRIMGAGVDVLSREPPRRENRANPLLEVELPNLIVTPHNAWASESATQKLAQGIVANIEAFVAGKPQNLVDSG